MSKKLICTAVCLYGHSNPSKEMLEDLNQQLLLLLDFHAAQGKGSMIIMGDFNAVEGQLSATVSQAGRVAGFEQRGHLLDV